MLSYKIVLCSGILKCVLKFIEKCSTPKNCFFVVPSHQAFLSSYIFFVLVTKRKIFYTLTFKWRVQEQKSEKPMKHDMKILQGSLSFVKFEKSQVPVRVTWGLNTYLSHKHYQKSNCALPLKATMGKMGVHAPLFKFLNVLKGMF